jgi:hypothetical protein
LIFELAENFLLIFEDNAFLDFGNDDKQGTPLWLDRWSKDLKCFSPKQLKNLRKQLFIICDSREWVITRRRESQM